MAEIGATPAGGCDRPALSATDHRARQLFSDWAVDAGATIRFDGIANLFARFEGIEDGPVVLLGSHLDTQPTGGRFDGVYGVLGALEVMRTIRDHGIATRRPIEIAVWTNEEGSRFPASMLGSAVWAGAMSPDAAMDLTDDEGITVRQAIERLGLSTDHTPRQDVHQAFELHIEQGPVLERAGTDIGVVTGVLGLRWFDLQLTGTAAHAGPTPMQDRRDPVRALAAIVDRVHRLVADAGASARATFARLDSSPASHNTVPATVRCTLDLRYHVDSGLEALDAGVRSILDEVGRATGVTATFEQRGGTAPVRFADECVRTVRASAVALGTRHQDIVSGAGHDACHVASVAPTSMIFIPCADGLSHNEAESITEQHAELGASVLLGAVLDAAELVG
jgi:N-carbamoyl-L-amino-acid hydrolase